MHPTAARFSFPQLHALAERLTSGAHSPAEICAQYLLLHLHARHPSQWLSSPRKSMRRGAGGLLPVLDQLGVSLSRRQCERVSGLCDIQELLECFYFRGIVLDSHEGLVGWLGARYPLKLRLDIPSPGEMLDAQCAGSRFVTLMLEQENQFVAHGRHRDACAFLLHDFEHAHKFFSDPVSFTGQVAFFQRLRSTLEYFSIWLSEAAFSKDLDYLKSDMNSHPVHLMKYLKAVVLSAEMRRTGERFPALDPFWRELFSEWGMEGETLAAALRMNQPECEEAQDLLTVARFFMPGLGESTCEAASLDAR